ncbi:transmembrane protein 131 isoform X1 [Leptinotarsa decemlineata]|uniref:transmembrane protein 131 isoform X1 n=1 Tax=Leptinotarsa decemlineata TaxID=7539 RepID=UPI003D30C78B
MFRNSLWWCIFTLSFLELVIKTHPTLHDSSHGFISKHSRYLDDELSGLHESFPFQEIASLKASGTGDVSLKLPLKFEPTILDFKYRPIGVPHLEKVTLFNIDRYRTIDMTSISGRTVHLHSSFFQEKKLPPNGNTSFNVVFLGREEGFIESNLFIHTSEGFMKYNVKGVSTFSHYRIRPIVGIKLPINSTFSPFIYIHNPHSEPIQIIEIFSSGGSFHLELPTGEHEGSNDLWEIPPQQTKAVIKVRYLAHVVQNHTAYIRIKLNKPDETLVIPIEVEVAPTMGLFHPQGFVDFGMGGNMDAPKEVKLCLFNPHKKHVRIHSVSTVSKAIKVQYYNIRLPPYSEDEGKSNQCVNVGTLTVDWKIAYETKDFSGKIIVKYRNGKNRSEIPYYITVLKGGITYNPLTTTYFINDKAVDLSSRSFKVKNEFEYPIQIRNVTFPQDAHLYFKIETLTPKVLRPSEETNIFNIKLKSNIRLSDLQLHSHIILRTNISDVTVPLLSYNGKLQVHLPFKSKDYSLDIGLIGFDSRKEVYFMVVNHNPVTLHLKNIHSSIPMTQAGVLGCGSGDYRLVLFQPSFSNLTRCHNLKAKHYAIIKVVVTTSHVEGQVWGDLYVETQFENLKVPVHFKIAPGRLDISSDKLIFDQCFPAKICSHPVRVHSTFNDPMIIEDIITLPPDKRISSRHTGHILARTSKIIGHVFLNLDVQCQADCYTGLQTDTSAQWLKTFSLPKFVSDFDLHLVNVFYNRYLNLTSNGMKKWQNITLRLDTSEVRGHIFKTRVKLSWPSLIVEQNSENRSVFMFPLTQVGNFTYLNITVRNPASYNVVVQLVFDRDYPEMKTLYNGLPPNLLVKNSREYTPTHGFFFPNNTKDKYLDFFSEMLGINANRNTVPILLTPGQTQSVLVGFYTEDVNPHSALLFLRNNLTILEVIRLNAQGAQPSFKFGNRKPGSTQLLTFDLTDKHFRECERHKSSAGCSHPHLTVKRTFTARNIGDVPLYIHSFHINDYACVGYGFRVMDCEPFVLPPNGTKKIDIAFTPDLTLTKITRTLILGTSLNIPVNYTLYTTIPSSYLHLCSDLIARPTWEIYLSYLTVLSMGILYIIILFAAMMDADRIRRQAMGSFIAPSSPTIQPVLDLRLVGQQIREEIQSAKTENVCEDKKVICEDKASQKELEDEIKPRSESDQYTAVVPTVSKPKKKLGKKNSIETNQSSPPCDVMIQEKFEKKQQKEKISEPKHKVKKESKELLRTEEKDKKHVQNIIQKEKEVKKPLCNNRKHTKNSSVPVYEEETSSTTTDSSSYYEDPEKENNQRNISKVCSKSKFRNVNSETSKPVIQENLNHTSEVKHVSFNHNHHHNRNKHQKSSQKTPKIDKQNKDHEANPKANEHHSHGKHHIHLREMKKRDRSCRDRKEKSNFHKKSSDKNKQNERQVKESDSIEKRKNASCFNISLPPSTVPCIWGESRARFSDVVARSDMGCSSNRPLAHSSKPVTNKPTMYVEPYKQTSSVELGPIGSKRLDCRPSNEVNRRSLNDDNFRLNGNNSRSTSDIIHDEYLNSENIILDSNSSYFSDELRLDNSSRENTYMDDTSAVSNWNHQQDYGNLIEPSDTNTSMEDPWNQSLLNSSTYWDSYNPLLNDPSLINDNSLLMEMSLSSPSQVTSQSAGYLWGSSSVWQPWAPEVTRTPTRTPPGFDEYLHRKRDDTPQPTRDSYSPFNTSPLWNQQQTNPWNYSQGH